jgi:hypothetical protein
MSRYLIIVILICLFLDGSVRQVADASNDIVAGIEAGIAYANNIPTLHENDIVDYLDLHVIPERNSYPVSETILFNISIMNTSNEDIVFHTHPGIYDLLIEDMTDTVVFRRPVPINQVYCTVGAGLMTTMQYSVTIGLSPGTYTVTASLPTGSAASAEFTVIVPTNGNGANK